MAYLTRYLEPGVLRFVAFSIVFVSLGSLLVSCIASHRGITPFGSWLGGDYSGFYIAGAILNKYPAGQLYNFILQNKILHTLLPGIPASGSLPFLNPPFFALIFRPLALLPFVYSYLVWILISAGLYIWSILLVRKTLHAIPAHMEIILLLLAISFEPFILENALGGNSSSFGFFAVASAIYFERTGKPGLQGLSLALCLYKPTYLLLIIPMLVFTRRKGFMPGFLLGAIFLAVVSFIFVGKQSCLDYLNVVSGVSQNALGRGIVFRTFKYTDLFSFFRLISGSFKLLYWLGSVATALIMAALLVKLWLKIAISDARRDLAFACTLTFTAVLNVHFGIYDTVIIVPAFLLAADVLYRPSGEFKVPALPAGFRALAILIYIIPWISQPVAIATGVQIFTLSLAAAGTYQFFLAMRAS